MRFRFGAWICAALFALALESGTLLAQTPVNASSKLARVLPAGVAELVLQRIEDARAHGLPVGVLEQRALELSAKGVAPDRLARAVEDQVERLESARRALAGVGRGDPTEDEIDAAATALGKGVGRSAVSDFAKSAPAGRSLAVPLIVVSSLIDRGLPADDALRRVVARLEARASDRQLEQLADVRNPSGNQIPSLTGQDLAASKRPTDVGRPDLIPTSAITTGARPTDGPPRPPGRSRP
jgi:hypothetical protein